VDTEEFFNKLMLSRKSISGILHSPALPKEEADEEGAGLSPLVEPYPPPGLNSSSLYPRVLRLQPELEGVVVGVA
jgi:hypothetical protein